MAIGSPERQSTKGAVVNGSGRSDMGEVVLRECRNVDWPAEGTVLVV